MCKNFKSIFPKFLKYFQARDNDTGAYSDLRFSLSDSIQGSGQSSYFSIDPMSGMVSTSKAFDRVQRDTLPFRLSVIVTDNPGDSENSKMEKTMLVVSVPLFLYVFLTPTALPGVPVVWFPVRRTYSPSSLAFKRVTCGSAIKTQFPSPYYPRYMKVRKCLCFCCCLKVIKCMSSFETTLS